LSTFAEFFAGIGLVRLALERQGWSALFANDNDPQKAAMYRANFADKHLCTNDIHDVSGTTAPPCDLFTASFPCNDLSVAGAKAGLSGKQSGTFWQFLRIVEEQGDAKPPLILLENVVGFLNSRGGEDFAAALLALARLGYVVDAMAINASHFTPQSRPRLFVVAKRQAMHGSTESIDCDARPPALLRFIAEHPEIPWDIRPLPPLPPIAHRLEEIVEELPPDDPLWWSEPRSNYFFNQLSERHRAVAERMIAGASLTYATAFRRVRRGRSMAELRTDGLAGCLRTPRGGSGRQILFQAGRDKFAVRLLSARECARLQGAPDSFRIEATLNRALFGFGDAVCVPVIEWIAEHYLTPCARTFASMSSRSTGRSRYSAST
jgi:DNA (cytosine-5)-methyltransferase 1